MNQRQLALAVFGLLLLTAFVVGAYVVRFIDAPVSADPQHWGQFGDYIGGTLNPLFGFVAFIGVLITIYLQSKQLHLMHQQSVLDELQRLIAGVSKDVDVMLQQRPKIVPKDSENERQTITVWSLLAGLGTAALDDNPHAQFLKARLINCIQLELQAILIEIHQLTWLLKEHIAAGGSARVSEFYRKRYEVLICWAHGLGLLGSYKRVEEFFEPQRLVPLLKGGAQ